MKPTVKIPLMSLYEIWESIGESFFRVKEEEKASKRKVKGVRYTVYGLRFEVHIKIPFPMAPEQEP